MKKILILILISGFLGGFIGAKPAYGATVQELDQQIKDLRNNITSQQNQINDIQGLISALDSQITTAQKEIDLSTQKINLTSQQIDQTQVQIEQKQKELEKKKIDLNEAIRTYYETGTPSTVEIIASANSLSDVINQSQYTEALSGQMNDQANQIIQVKSDLETAKTNLQNQKTDIENQKSSMVEKKQGLDAQKNQKNNLLSQTDAQKSQYQSDLNSILKERNRKAAATYSGGRTGGSVRGGSSVYDDYYPVGGLADDYGFITRQCTSYVAWYWNVVLGRSWYRGSGPPGTGDAENWRNLAARNNVSTHDSPQKGAIISWYAIGSYGHVAIVEAVNGNGTIDVSEYNYIRPGEIYSYRSGINPAGDGPYVYIY